MKDYEFKNTEEDTLKFSSKECTEGNLFSFGSFPTAAHDSSEDMTTTRDDYTYRLCLQRQWQRHRVKELLQTHLGGSL